MRCATQEEIEKKAESLAAMTKSEVDAFNKDVLEWWLNDRKIDIAKDIEAPIKTASGKERSSQKERLSESTDFAKAWEAIIYTTDSFDPSSEYKYIQQLRSIIKKRDPDISESGSSDAWWLNKNVKLIRRLRRAVDDYNAHTTGRQIDHKNIPDWFFEVFSASLPGKKISPKSLKQLWINTSCPLISIDPPVGDNGGDEEIQITIPDGGCSVEEIIILAVRLTDLFVYAVKCGGAKKKSVFEKINANIIFGCDTLFDIRSFWDYVEHEYVRYFSKTNCTPNDAAVIFHHWFYSNEIPRCTAALRETKEWGSKKSNFSTTYRKPYNVFAKASWNSTHSKGEKSHEQ